MKTTYLLPFLLLFFMAACKNESGNNTPAADPASEAPSSTTSSSKEVSSLETLDHTFNVTPEGSRLFFKGFFMNSLVDAAMTVNKGTLHVKNGIITSANFNLDMRTIETISNRNTAVETFMKSAEAFDAVKYQNGSFIIERCDKAINDQEATHILKGKIELHGKSVPVTVRVRIDYKPKLITILSDQIIIKGDDLGIKMANPSQENIYFSLTLNAELF
ncbi:MAG: YceI family protein [Saprospiraceae bacterium]|nr:YceI family protein [Saprospiraceae bacterium]